MSKWQYIMRFVPRGNKLVILLYAVFFGVLLMRTLPGVGQYWDWVFPYYAEHTGNFFARASESWTRDANGSPLGYSTDYLLRFFISLFGFMPPELLLYGILVATFTIGSYLVYLIARRHTRPGAAFLFGVVTFVNPVIFYNFTAGYVNFLVSYAAFIYLVYFMLYRFRPDLRSAVIVGLVLTIIGVQIQNFAVAGALLVLFFVFRPGEWRWRYGLVILGLPLLIALVWLSNFLFGGANLSEVSGSAAKATFKGLADSNYLSIFSFSFAKATLIARFYTFYELLLYGLFFVFMIVMLLRAKRKQADDVFLLVFMLLMLFLATGLFQLLNLGPVTMIYPMFREVGHFAPLIVLAMIVLMARLMARRGVLKWFVAGWLVLIIFVSFVKFQANSQSIPFAGVRQQFAEFEQFAREHKDANHRVLAYPFFDQYAFTKFPMKFQDNLPLQNSGHDSFTAFSPEQFIKNAVKPHDFKSSVQYRLLTTMDADVLQPYGVRYIYDFSGIYESYYDRYVAPATYNNNVALIKNNPYFMEDLLAANPGKLRRVSPRILEVVDYTSRVAPADRLYKVNSVEAGEDSRWFMQKVAPGKAFNYTVDPKDSMPYGSVAPLFGDIRDPHLLNTSQKSLEQTVAIPEGNQAKLYGNTMPRILSYRVSGQSITFYATSYGKLYVNDQLLQDYDAAEAQTIGSLPLLAGVGYYVSLNGNLVPLEGQSGRIGTIMYDSELRVFATAHKNIITNASFEDGLWSQQVDDCNAYDDKPDIAMKLNESVATDGSKSLELIARRHDACTSTHFSMTPNSAYLLSYDYKGQDAQSASFYIRFNNSDENAIKRFQGIADSDWHSMSQLIVTPEGTTTGGLTLHATASDGERAAVNYYDNVRLVGLQQIGVLEVRPEARYQTLTLPNSSTLKFRLQDDTFDYQNVIQNHSFEQGAWQKEVTDCNNYDKTGDIAARISTSSKSTGDRSLQLEATRHTACQYANAKVAPDTDYLLSFDYQGDGAQQTGFYLEYTGEGEGEQERIDISDRQWHTFTTRIHIPETVSDVRLYLHAYESNGTARNTVRFDNVRLIAVPTTQDQFYVLSEPEQLMEPPQNLTYAKTRSTLYEIGVKGATKPFMVSLSESYHPQWRLELHNEKVTGARSWLPGAEGDTVGKPFKLSGYANAWYLDPAALCEGDKQGCRRNTDGSYDIELVAEFVPQRWFEVNRAISVGTLIAAGVYVAATHRRARRLYEAEEVYRHPLARRRDKKP